jgi:hypothetical protein
MERVNSRISQAYGYAVCFIAVVVMLIGRPSLVGNLLLIVLASTLFAVHWRWLRKRDAISG